MVGSTAVGEVRGAWGGREECRGEERGCGGDCGCAVGTRGEESEDRSGWSEGGGGGGDGGERVLSLIQRAWCGDRGETRRAGVVSFIGEPFLCRLLLQLGCGERERDKHM